MQAQTIPELYPMYGLWHTPFWQTAWFFYSVIAFASILLIVILWYSINLYRNKKVHKAPWIVALSQLEELKQTLNKRHDDGINKEFYVRLIKIIKHYWYKRFNLDIESKTDEELIVFLKQTFIHQDHLQHIQEVCTHATVSKFASATLDHAVLEHDLECCITIIKETIPQPQK